MGKSNLVHITVRDVNGNWIPVSTTVNQNQSIKIALDNAEKMYPNKRIKAVDNNGNMVDFRN